MTDIYVDGKALQSFTATVFEKVGLPVEDAAIEAIRDESYRSRGIFYHKDDGSFADY